ncbi:MAG: hypothetical protein QOG43_2214 [Actinomycetota bacterium]|nr:hypothetical protein [Actinomycetota bacterium]
MVDAVTVVLALLVAFWLCSFIPSKSHPEIPEGRHLLVGLLSLPIWITMLVRYQLYKANQVAQRRQEFRRLTHAVGASVAAMALVAFMGKLYVARGWLVLSLVIALLLLTAEREAVRRILTALRRKGRMLRRVVIVGGNEDAVAIGAMLMADPRLGYDIVGFVDDPPDGDGSHRGAPALRSVAHTRQVVEESGAQGVIIVATAVGMAAVNRLARDLTDVGIRVEVVSGLRDIAVERLSLRSVGGFPVMHLERVHRQGWRAVAKRSFDVAVAVVALILALPVLVACVIAIKATSPGPVLFRQKRLGRHGDLFDVLKLRTMVPNAVELLSELQESNEADGPLFKMRSDPRITKVGRVMRRFSMDELPQFWNVLRGEMAIVGPRPALPQEAAGWSPELHQRLRVKPGITGMWQVGGRSDASFEEYTRLDLYYVDNWSLLVDLTILAQTIPAVFRGGAY